MKLSELIEQLTLEKSVHGDIEVYCQATAIDDTGMVSSGHGYYGLPYEICQNKRVSDGELGMFFDVVINEEDEEE